MDYNYEIHNLQWILHVIPVFIWTRYVYILSMQKFVLAADFIERYQFNRCDPFYYKSLLSTARRWHSNSEACQSKSAYVTYIVCI